MSGAGFFIVSFFVVLIGAVIDFRIAAIGVSIFGLGWLSIIVWSGLLHTQPTVSGHDNVWIGPPVEDRSQYRNPNMARWGDLTENQKRDIFPGLANSARWGDVNDEQKARFIPPKR